MVNATDVASQDTLRECALRLVTLLADTAVATVVVTAAVVVSPVASHATPAVVSATSLETARLVVVVLLVDSAVALASAVPENATTAVKKVTSLRNALRSKAELVTSAVKSATSLPTAPKAPHLPPRMRAGPHPLAVSRRETW